MENQKKEKNKKRIVLVVVLLLCCCTCVAVFVKKGIAKKSERSGVLVAVDAQTVDVDKEAAEEKETTEATDGKKDEKLQADKKPEVTETVASASGKKTESSADKPKTTEAASGQNSKTETKKENTQTGQTKTTEAPAKQNTTEPTKPKTTESAPKTTETVTAPSVPKTTEATTEAPQKQRVWVVDQAAYDEERPVYETKCRWICTGCGGYMYTQEDIDNHPCVASWYSDTYYEQTGTETIHHDEVGHWEWQ